MHYVFLISIYSLTPNEGVLALKIDDGKYYPAQVATYIKKTNKYQVTYYDSSKECLSRNQFYAIYENGFLTCSVRIHIAFGF